MKLDTLLDHLHAANLQATTLEVPGGGVVVVTSHGARILGLFTSRDADNLYFVNPELAGRDMKRYLAGEHVLGGDRVWLSPERGLFFKGDRLEDGVSNQPSIDPANWLTGKSTPSSVRFTTDFAAAYFQVPGSTVRGVMDRSIRTIANPFTYTPERFPAGVTFAGYEIASSLALSESPRDDLYVGLWFLIQVVVPHGGHAYVPTLGKTVITDYYEKTGADYLRVRENHVRFRLDSLQRHKIGIRKTEVTGRLGFLSNGEPNGEATLIVRNFLNDPSAHYADVPLHTPEGTQDSVQSYNHYSGPTGFGELEFHTPGINRSMSEPVVHDTNQVWAFNGPRPALVKVAAFLLNLPMETFDLAK